MLRPRPSRTARTSSTTASPPANLLCDGTAITGVIDINPVLAGDRAFGLATLLFYHYDHEQIGDQLRGQLLDLAGPRPARAYLAHMVLRQLDWSLRHHPAAPATRRHLRLATAITTDIAGSVNLKALSHF